LPSLLKFLIVLVVLFTTTSARAITNGEESSEDAHGAVVALLSKGEVTCTGVLVGPYAIATAAHCLRPTAPDQVFFGADPTGDGVSIDIVETRVHVDFSEDDLSNDIGLVGLAKKAPARPVRLYDGELDDEALTNASIRIVGFGATNGTGDSSDPIKREGISKIQTVESDVFRLVAAPSQTCTGDSGGPAFITIDDEDVLIGITSSGDVDCKSYGRDLRVDAYKDFIESHTTAYSRRAKTNQLAMNSGCSMTTMTTMTTMSAVPGGSTLLAFALIAVVAAFVRRTRTNSRS
jgi:secreted trypsin-like serine protease